MEPECLTYCETGDGVAYVSSGDLSACYSRPCRLYYSDELRPNVWAALKSFADRGPFHAQIVRDAIVQAKYGNDNQISPKGDTSIKGMQAHIPIRVAVLSDDNGPAWCSTACSWLDGGSTYGCKLFANALLQSVRGTPRRCPECLAATIA